LAKKSAKEPVKKPAKKPAKETTRNSALGKDTAAGTSAQDVPREAAAAATGGPITTSGAATALSTASASGVVSLDEGASLSAALLEEPRTRPLWEVQEVEVAIPAEIAEPFDRWRADPSDFLRSDSVHIPSSLKEHYYYALSVRNSAVSNKILWRFISTAYYDVISGHSFSDRYSITRDAVAFAVTVICESLHGREAVERNVISWAKEGAKYRTLADELEALAKELGTPVDKSEVLGCYFFLPDFSEWM
jgi:hypothetical protein